MKYLFLTAFIFCLQHQAFSQKLLAGNSISYLKAAGDFGDSYHTGFGVNFNGELNLFGQLGITGELGWNHWNADNNNPGPELPNADAFDLLIGGKIGLSFMYLELRAGYLFGDLEEFIIIPAAGLRLGKFDLNVGYQMVSDLNYLSFRLGYFWI